MSTLTTPHRKLLETAVKHARRIATEGARKSLEALAVHEPEPYPHMGQHQLDLRSKLLAQARQLGDGENPTRRGACEIKRLVEKLAYDQWHRLLFARYLLENQLLISPEHGVPVGGLDDCEDFATILGLKDAWAVAARFAAVELPEIFRADDPAGAVELPVEDRKPLIALVTGLPVDVFTAGDSLGWCYQFWQAERKAEINKSEVPRGADEIPAVTQLFTEDYMVDFLLDNTLGAWWAGKKVISEPLSVISFPTEEAARAAVALPGCPWKYLRFVRTSSFFTEDSSAATDHWLPAAGTFDGWPTTAQELKCLDPCMGSGHFVVALFERLVALRVADESLDEADAADAVIRDNLFGLEIDPRCTQIAAFNLALAAWRRVGHRTLPAMNLACSGLAPNTSEADWVAIAGDDDKLQRGMERLYRLFQKSAVLGSLINPRAGEGDLLVAAFHELQPLLEMALAREVRNDTAHEMAVTARGLVKAAEILSGQFTLVATNVPYLKRGNQSDVLTTFADDTCPDAKMDLATMFMWRCGYFVKPDCTCALVTPHTWQFLGAYKVFRKDLLQRTKLAVLAQLGSGAFETISGEVVNVCLLTFTKQDAGLRSDFSAVDVSSSATPIDKSNSVIKETFTLLSQHQQLSNPDGRIIFSEVSNLTLLSAFATGLAGYYVGDSQQFDRKVWEVGFMGTDWEFCQTTVEVSEPFAGRCSIVLWEKERGQMYRLAQSVRHLNHAAQNWLRGKPNWRKSGVVVSQMGDLPVTLYLGDIYDCNCCAIVPNEPDHLPALWAYCSSGEFAVAIRQVDRSIKVTPRTLLKVPFDLERWQKVAAEKYPHGLPTPFSSDPTQWLFNGQPKGSDQPLHVAVARLLGYQWPRQTGSSFPDCPALGPDGLEPLADEDGIVCLSATKGEAPAAERLRSFLAQNMGKFDLAALLASAGPKGSKAGSLEDWLRDEFFEQHCALFHQRPFIWHLWDGHKNGFSALVNYHKLSHANLEKLTYAYLGDWIRRQDAAVKAEEAGSDARLQAAKVLQSRLKLILEGEPPYDIFVRWKPLSKQAIGWHPDLNDGVRMNIRPFMATDIPGGKKGAGILRIKPAIKWDKDRGKEPHRDKAEFPWYWGWDEEKQDFGGIGKEPDGNRWNDCHYGNEFKGKAGHGAFSL